MNCFRVITAHLRVRGYDQQEPAISRKFTNRRQILARNDIFDACLDLCWNLIKAVSGRGEDIGSGSEVNRLVSEFLGEGLPPVDFAHGDVTRGEQCPEQHGCGLGRRQHGLGFNPALELFMEPFDGVGGANTLPLAARQPGEGEEPVTGLIEAVGYRLAGSGNSRPCSSRARSC